jgi:hypothetical protein
MFVSGRPLQSNLMLVGKPGAYPKSEHLKDEGFILQWDAGSEGAG